MITRGVMLLAAFSVFALTVTPSHAAGRTERGDYVGGSFATGRCQTATEPGIALVCFDLRPTDVGKRITVVATDLALGPAPYFWIFTDADGSCVGANPDPSSTEACPNSGFGCGQLKWTVPAKAVTLHAFTQDPVLGTVTCQLFEPNPAAVGPTIAGSVTLTVP